MEIVAEIGAAHNGSLQNALNTIDAAVASGATAVKLQCWTPDTMDAGGRYLDAGPWKGRSLRELYREAWTPWDWIPTLASAVTEHGLKLGISVFDKGALDFVMKLPQLDFLKIASFEATDLALIRACARTDKWLVISLGQASGEIMHTLPKVVIARNTVLLHCVSEYPASAPRYGMRAIPRLLDWPGYPVGLSDHTKSVVPAVMATTMGAVMIERHITLTPNGKGLDDGFASSPDEFKAMAMAVNDTLAALNEVKPVNSYLRRSLWVVKDVQPGDEVTEDNVQTRRPDDGLSPLMWGMAVRKTFTKAVKADTPFSLGHIA